MPKTSVPKHAQVIIIGGGVIGLSTAYHLGKLGFSDVILLERNELTSGTSWHAAGIVGPLRPSMNLTKLSIYATKLFAELEAETGQATGYKQTGGLWVAQSSDRLTELKRIAAMGDLTGLDAQIISASEVAQCIPQMKTDDLTGALWVTEDGQVNPVDLCMAYAKGARQSGVQLFEHVGVKAITQNKGAVSGVTLDDGQEITCDYVVNCAGVWSTQVGAMAGVSVPVQAVEHMYVVTDPMDDLPSPFPILRDLDAGIYIKEDAGKLVLGGFEPNAKPWDVNSVPKKSSYLMFDEDWDQFEPFMYAGLNRIPALEHAGIQHFMNGPEGFTPDTKQVMGEAPNLKNFFVAAGFNSIGIVSSAGAGRALAEWIIEGHAPMDMWEVDIARFEPHAATKTFMENRVREAVGTQFEMHWPLKQLNSSRHIKRSPFHQPFADKCAFFGAPTGWERPLWFASNPAECAIDYSYGQQSWWAAAAREAKALENGVALFELTPFTKLLVQGRDSLSLLQRLCTSNIDTAVDQSTYTQMLNHSWGIEADITVTRLKDDQFFIVSGAATRIKDKVWIERNTLPEENVTVTDMTSAYAVLGIMGPKSRALLQSLTTSNLSNAAFPFSSSQDIDLGSAIVRATRVSFVGELGWEIYIPMEFAQSVYEAICEAGEKFDLSHAGHMCLDSCRLEKGYRHWGHDIGPEETPYHAGLSFCIDYAKSADFIGKEAVLVAKDKGVDRHLLLFKVEGDQPLILHDEPIYRDGEIVGQTTSGGQGFRTGLTLALGYVAANTKKEALQQAFEIDVAGERFTLTPLAKPPYDPTSLKLKS